MRAWKPGTRVLLFVLLAFVFTWVPQLVLGSTTGWRVDQSLLAWSITLSLCMFAPLASALITRAVTGGGASIGWRPRVRGNVRWYVVALLAPSVLTALGAVVYFLLVPGDFDPSASRYMAAVQAQLGVTASQAPLVLVAQLAFAALVAPFLNMLLAVGEEAGWRGFLYPELRERLSRPAAVIATGAIWGAWHAPVIAMGYNYGTSYLGFPALGILCMVAFCVAFGTLLCVLRDATDSVWASALAHGAINAVAGTGLYFSQSGRLGLLGPATLGILACIPTIVLCVVLLVMASRGVLPQEKEDQ